MFERFGRFRLSVRAEELAEYPPCGKVVLEKFVRVVDDYDDALEFLTRNLLTHADLAWDNFWMVSMVMSENPALLRSLISQSWRLPINKPESFHLMWMVYRSGLYPEDVVGFFTDGLASFLEPCRIEPTGCFMDLLTQVPDRAFVLAVCKVAHVELGRIN